MQFFPLHTVLKKEANPSPKITDKTYFPVCVWTNLPRCIIYYNMRKHSGLNSFMPARIDPLHRMCILFPPLYTENNYLPYLDTKSYLHFQVWDTRILVLNLRRKYTQKTSQMLNLLKKRVKKHIS